MNLYLFIILFIFKSLWFRFYTDKVRLENHRIHFIEDYKKYQAEKDFGIKKFSIDISVNGFIRYKRTTISNKIEYFSVRLDKVNEMKYLGTEKAGWIVLKCENESIIYQTYEDTNGNTDQMINQFRFPIKNIDVDAINLWLDEFNGMKKDFLNTQN